MSTTMNCPIIGNYMCRFIKSSNVDDQDVSIEHRLHFRFRRCILSLFLFEFTKINDTVRLIRTQFYYERSVPIKTNTLDSSQIISACSYADGPQYSIPEWQNAVQSIFRRIFNRSLGDCERVHLHLLRTQHHLWFT